MTPPKIQDLIHPPPGPETALTVPADLLPEGAVSGHVALWDPSVGAPTCWLLSAEFLDANQEPCGIVSATFLAPDAIREEGERLMNPRDWHALGAWFLGMVFAAVGHSVPVLSSKEGGPRGYEFSYVGQIPFGLLDVVAGPQPFEVSLGMLRRMCSLHFQHNIGDHEQAIARAEELGEGLARQLSADFILRRQD